MSHLHPLASIIVNLGWHYKQWSRLGWWSHPDIWAFQMPAQLILLQQAHPSVTKRYITTCDSLRMLFVFQWMGAIIYVCVFVCASVCFCAYNQMCAIISAASHIYLFIWDSRCLNSGYKTHNLDMKTVNNLIQSN